MDLSNFETFTRRLAPLGNCPYVTIQKRGILSLNRIAFMALGAPAAVELLYNRTDQVVAIKGASIEVPHAHALRAVGRATVPNTYVLAAMSFLQHYGIASTKSLRREAGVSDGVLLIDLKVEGTLVTSNRSARDREE